MTLLADRAVLLAKIESVFRTDAVPDPSTDALLIGSPEFNIDINQLTRDNVRDDLSPLATTPGRKVASVTFTHEVRNNGNQTGTIPPRLDALLRACGMARTQVTGIAGTLGTPAPNIGNAGTMTFVKAAAYTGYIDRTVTLEVTTGGGTGVAKVTVSAPGIGETAAYNVTNVTVTNGTPIALPGGGSITPNITAPLQVGDKWFVDLNPSGYEYTPVSANFESATLYLYRDGLLHKLTGCRGTFSMQATGGEYAVFSFTMTGDYVPITDAAMPSPTYETQKPTQVELANLTVGNFENFAAAEFSFDIQNDVQIREDVNALNAYAGGIIVGRQPQVSFNPETVLEATHPVWGNLSDGTELSFKAKVGKVKGNVVQFEFPNVQYSNVQYGDRNSTLIYDITLNAARVTGNDEVRISFR